LLGQTPFGLCTRCPNPRRSVQRAVDLIDGASWAAEAADADADPCGAYECPSQSKFRRPQPLATRRRTARLPCRCPARANPRAPFLDTP
jgi:hypothetical protein